MHIWFSDDSRQRKPSRMRMGPIVAAGAIGIPELSVQVIEASLNDLCVRTGFPSGEEFKWSPGRELWMHTSLRDHARTIFFRELFNIARINGVVGIMAAVDADFKTVTGASSHEMDVVSLLLERIHHQTSEQQRSLVVADKPSGGSATDTDHFLARCAETLTTGTTAMKSLSRICMVLTCSSRLNRCLQLADVFTSCLTAYIAGEDRYSPEVAKEIRPILRREMDRIGGCGVKLHPDYKYANLYHWLFGDQYFYRANVGSPMPLAGRPYAAGSDLF